MFDHNIIIYLRLGIQKLIEYGKIYFSYRFAKIPKYHKTALQVKPIGFRSKESVRCDDVNVVGAGFCLGLSSISSYFT